MKNIACNYCNSTKYRTIIKNYDRSLKVNTKIFNIVQCNKCNLVYLNPQPSVEELME